MFAIYLSSKSNPSTMTTDTSTFEDDDRITYETLNNTNHNTDAIISPAILGALYQRMLDDDKGLTAPDAADEDSTTTTNEQIDVILKLANGERHLLAISSLLRVSRSVAAKLTVTTLRQQQIPAESLGGLVGSPAFLCIVRDTYYIQRLSRLRGMTEVLRVDLDESHVYHSECRKFLDEQFASHDAMGKLLYQFLRRATTLEGDHCKAIFNVNAFYEQRDKYEGGKHHWGGFYNNWNMSAEVQVVKEREQALEAMITLLYSRYDLSGQSRATIILTDIIRAFLEINFYVASKSPTSSFPKEVFAKESRSRLSKLAAMLCIESIGLWRTAETSGIDWISEHMLLSNFAVKEGDTTNAMDNNRTLIELFELMTQRVMSRRYETYTALRINDYDDKVEKSIDKPEALVVLGFGLLLRLGCNSKHASTSLIEAGLSRIELSPDLIMQNANDAGAFDYMEDALDTLISNSCNVGGERVIYASISRELFGASIRSIYMNSSDYSTDISQFKGSPSDLYMFCNLAFKIHRDQQDVCASFWEYWDGVYCRSDTMTAGPHSSVGSEMQPTCKLLELAYSLNASAQSRKAPHSEIMSCAAPLLRLLSGLACDEDSSVCAFTIAQHNLIEVAVKGSLQVLLTGNDYTSSGAIVNAGDNIHNDEEDFALVAVDFLYRLSKSGGSKVRNALAKILDESVSSHFATTLEKSGGAQAFVNGSCQSRSPKISARIWSMLSYFTMIHNESPDGWFNVISRRYNDSIFALLKQYDRAVTSIDENFLEMTESATLIYSSVVANFAKVCMEEDVDVQLFQHQLSLLLDGGIKICDVLSLLFSFVEKLTEDNPYVGRCLDAMSAFFECITSSLDILGSLARADDFSALVYLITDVREKMVHRLYSDLKISEGIVSCITFPISTAFHVHMGILSQGHSASSQLSQQSMWNSMFGDGKGQQVDPKIRAEKILNQPLQLNDGILGTGRHNRSYIKLALNAVSLLLSWGSIIEDVVEECCECSFDLLMESRDDVDAVKTADPDLKTKIDQMETELKALSPVNILLALSRPPTLLMFDECTENPTNSSVIFDNWADCCVSSILLIAQYVGNKVYPELSDKAFDCLTLYLRHRPSPAALSDSHIKASLENKKCLQFVNLSISTKHSVATSLLSTASVCKEIFSILENGVDAIQSSVGLNCVDIDLVVEAAKCIALLWESTRGRLSDIQESSTGTGSKVIEVRGICRGVDVFLSCEKLWIVLCDVVKMVPNVLKRLDFSQENRNTRSKILNLLAYCLQVLSVEIHTSFHSLPSHLLEFLDNAGKDASYDSWTETFVHFDGDLLADFGETIKGVFEVEQVFRSPATFSSRSSLKSNQAYDTSVASKFSLRQSIVDALEDANSSWRLSLAQACTIRSWKRFMDVSILRSHRSPSLHRSTSGNSTQGPGFPATPINSDRGGVSPSPLVLGNKRFNNNAANKVSPLTHNVLPRLPKKSSFVGDNRSYFMIRHFLQALVSHGNCVNDIFDLNAISTSESLCVELSEALVSMLHHQLVDVVVKALEPSDAKTEFRSNSKLGKEECVELLYILQSTSTRLFGATRPVTTDEQRIPSAIVRRRKYMLACQLRLHLFTAALLLIQAHDTNQDQFHISSPTKFNSSGLSDRNFISAKLGFVDLVCESLSLLAYSTNGWSRQPNATFPYNFEVESGRFASPGANLPYKLLRMSLHLLKLLLPSSDGYMYPSDLVSALAQGGFQRTIGEHVKVASIYATGSIFQNSASQVGAIVPEANDPCKRALDIIQACVEILSKGAVSPELATFFIRDGFVFRLLADNNLLQTASLRWASLPHNISHIRGYLSIPKSTNNLSRPRSTMSSGSPKFIDDPVHRIWLWSIRVVSTTVRTLLSSYHAEEARSCLSYTISFLRTFEGPILSGLVIHEKAIKSGTSLSLTANGLQETAECLNLMKAICSQKHVRLFASTAPELSSQLLRISLMTLRSLSAFLQSTNVARDLFTAVTKIQALENNTAALDTPSMQDILSLSHVQSAPSAKHDAIKHSQFANNSCSCMTAEDLILHKEINGQAIPTCSSPLKKGRSSSDLAQSITLFRNSIDNDFIRKIEKTALQCVVNCLAIISQVHPSSFSWVSFEKNELDHASVSNLIKRGSVIAICPPFSSKAVHGKVLSKNPDSSINVQYVKTFDGRRTDRIEISMIVGIQDTAAKLSVLKFDAAPQTSLDASISQTSLGHLVLCLRWCRQFWTMEPSSRGQTQCLAERCALLLEYELNLYKEAADNNIVSALKPEVKASFYYQLFELFDESTDTNVGRVTDSTPLKKIISPKVFQHISSKLQDVIDMVKSDKENNQDKQFRSPRNTYGRRRRTTNVNRIRTPYVGVHTPALTPKS